MAMFQNSRNQQSKYLTQQHRGNFQSLDEYSIEDERAVSVQSSPSKCSVVSSDSNLVRNQRQSSLSARETWVMNRLQWISYSQILFNQLEQNSKQKQVTVQQQNFVSALFKILPLLPLIECYEGAEKTISFKQVFDSINKIKHAYISMDQILDAVLDCNECSKCAVRNKSVVLDNMDVKTADMQIVWSDSDSDDNCEVAGSFQQQSTKKAEPKPQLKRALWVHSDEDLLAATIEEPTKKGLFSTQTINFQSQSIVTVQSVTELDLSQKLKSQIDITPQVSQTTKHMSLAMNSLVKIPFGLPCKSLVVLNISANKLKSFVGLEQCTNLKLINASKNQLSSLAGIQQLTGMKELYLGSNHLTSLSEIKNLQLTHLDVSYNRLSDFDQLKVLSAQIISLTGNSVASLRDFNFQFQKWLPKAKLVEPLQVQVKSQWINDTIPFAQTNLGLSHLSSEASLINISIGNNQTTQSSIINTPRGPTCKKVQKPQAYNALSELPVKRVGRCSPKQSPRDIQNRQKTPKAVKQFNLDSTKVSRHASPASHILVKSDSSLLQFKRSKL